MFSTLQMPGVALFGGAKKSDEIMAHDAVLQCKHVIFQSALGELAV
jgi:hypothetical protein